MSDKHFKKVMDRCPPGMQALSNMVIFLRVQKEFTPGGIAVGQGAIEGLDHIVLSVGPKAEGLEPGDLIVVNGKRGEHYDTIPNSTDIFITGHQYVVYKYGNVKDWPEDMELAVKPKGRIQTAS